MNYEWNKKLLSELKKNHTVKEELAAIYNPLLGIYQGGLDFLHREQTLKENLLSDGQLLSEYLFLKDYEDKIHAYDEALYEQDEHILAPGYRNTLSQEKIMGLTYKFYHNMVPKEFFDKFYEVFSQRTQNFRFSNPKLTYRYVGMTNYSPTANQFFIEVKDQKNIESLFTTIHEYGHVVGELINENTNTSLATYLTICEVESIFMELIAQDYFEKQKDLRLDVKHRRISFYESFVIQADDLNKKIKISDAFNHICEKNPNLTYNDLYGYLRAECQLDAKTFKGLLQTPAYCMIKYEYSTLIALELYHIYQTDPERAFDLYKKIIQINATSADDIDYEIKKLGLNLTEHLDTYTNKLIRG